MTSRSNIPNYSDERMLFEMQRLAAYIGDGHTYVLPLGAAHVREASFRFAFICSPMGCS